jgi:2-polyprenyl-6-methoxyphenol hydroxylase-like FAD-dependent oxidoreductase
MRITCIGGGPAGLYFALLMKLQDPAHAVTLLERNRADDTFGWGVVFSDQTLGALARADAKTASQILDAFNHWDDIEVHIRGRPSAPAATASAASAASACCRSSRSGASSSASTCASRPTARTTPASRAPT